MGMTVVEVLAYAPLFVNKVQADGLTSNRQPALQLSGSANTGNGGPSIQNLPPPPMPSSVANLFAKSSECLGFFARKTSCFSRLIALNQALL